MHMYICKIKAVVLKSLNFKTNTLNNKAHITDQQWLSTDMAYAILN